MKPSNFLGIRDALRSVNSDISTIKERLLRKYPKQTKNDERNDVNKIFEGLSEVIAQVLEDMTKLQDEYQNASSDERASISQNQIMYLDTILRYLNSIRRPSATTAPHKKQLWSAINSGNNAVGTRLLTSINAVKKREQTVSLARVNAEHSRSRAERQTHQGQSSNQKRNPRSLR